MSSPTPEFVETPAGAIRELLTEVVLIDRFRFEITKPVEYYDLLDDPTLKEALKRDEYMPYWADIWPVSRMLGKAIAKEDWSKHPKTGDKLEAIELGCGLGIPGLTALACGLRVTFSDYDLTAMKFAGNNARANKLHDFKTLAIDWRQPPTDVKYPVILGADLSYELRKIDPLVALIKNLLAPGGLCLLTDQDRSPAPILRQKLGEYGLRYRSEKVRAAEPGGPRMHGTLYRITHA